ncbi:BT_3928 family protein [Spongiivirga citrea]|uniref:DoxX family membrane protein n=1 Tax=Spongiivirga citrea TaxID=1481457 RepID=A0A6M0CPB3_9FLAO|nr:BT_3928 family protein [Spongiivirga citrea]NER17884.1 DoxX family membrane protein [Spongiivirga citrea]
MNIITQVCRMIVGVLFIISGFVKLTDPLGFSYKLEEYFSPEVLGLDFLAPHALTIAMSIVIFECILGVMLILGDKPKFTSWSLLLLIVFFTGLTGYSAITGKVTDCGCFGDAMKLTPVQSFIKDLVLLVLILIIFFNRNKIKPLFTKRIATIGSVLALVASTVYTMYMFNHLPAIDFRPYKINANIIENMTVPEDAPKAVFDYYWKFDVNGKEEIIKTTGEYPSSEGTFVSVDTKMVTPGYEAPIHDYIMELDGVDYTEQLMQEENLIILHAFSLRRSDKKGFEAVKSKIEEAIDSGYKVIGMTASSASEIDELKQEFGFNFDFYFCDETTLKTMIRSNPAVMKLSKGTILQKLHYNDIDELELEKVGPKLIGLNLKLKKQLDSISNLDQGIRFVLMQQEKKDKDSVATVYGIPVQAETPKYFDLYRKIDSTNLIFAEKILTEYGYPGKSMVGEPTNNAIWYVIQHNMDKIGEYIEVIKKAGAAGEIEKTLVATMEDRLLMHNGEPQIYGTQGMSYSPGQEFIWPIKDPKNVNERRKEMGFDTTIEEYALALYGDAFVYMELTLEDAKRLQNQARNNSN